MGTLVQVDEALPATGPKPVPPADSPAMSVRVVQGLEALEEHRAAWEALAAAALEPNIFYEPWMLVPAIRAFGGDRLQFVLIYGPDPARPSGPDRLCGFFPVERQNRLKGLPATLFKLWRHKHCFLCTPLLRADCARETLDAFFDWLATTAKIPVVNLAMVSGEGPFHHLLVDEFRATSRFVFLDDAYTRAFLRRHRDGEAYIQASVKGHHRRKIKRLERMLAETGTVDYAALSPADDAEPWLQAFLRMEAASWKGREGTALASNPADEQYFLDIGREAQRRGRLLMFALRLDGEPIALNSYVRAGDGCFYFKPSFVEQHARFSPGRLLEVETVHRFHGPDGVAWADSCTATDNELLNSLWLERRAITSLYVSSGRAGGDLVVAVLPIMRWMSRQLRRLRAPTRRSPAPQN